MICPGWALCMLSIGSVHVSICSGPFCFRSQRVCVPIVIHAFLNPRMANVFSQATAEMRWPTSQPYPMSGEFGPVRKDVGGHCSCGWGLVNKYFPGEALSAAEQVMLHRRRQSQRKGMSCSHRV